MVARRGPHQYCTDKFHQSAIAIGRGENRAKAKAATRDIKTITLSERLSALVGDISAFFGSFSEFFSKVCRENLNFLSAVMRQIQHAFTAVCTVPQLFLLALKTC